MARAVDHSWRHHPGATLRGEGVMVSCTWPCTRRVCMAAAILGIRAGPRLRWQRQPGGGWIRPFWTNGGVAVADLNGDGLDDVLYVSTYIEGAPPLRARSTCCCDRGRLHLRRASPTTSAASLDAGRRRYGRGRPPGRRHHPSAGARDRHAAEDPRSPAASGPQQGSACRRRRIKWHSATPTATDAATSSSPRRPRA